MAPLRTSEFEVVDLAELGQINSALPGMLTPADDPHFVARVYKTENADGFNHYVVAFRGTQSGFVPAVIDWFHNVSQTLGFGSSHYRRSLDIADAMKAFVDREKAAGHKVSLEFTGHSKGGAQAAVASAATGAPAHTFNGAPVNPDTMTIYQREALADLEENPELVQAIQLEGDAVTHVSEENLGLAPLVHNTAGEKRKFASPDGGMHGFDAHRMPAVINGLDQTLDGDRDRLEELLGKKR